MGTPINPGCLLISRNDLFGARMLPFMNALRIGHDYDLPVKIYWPVHATAGTNIGEHADIFSADFIDKHFISETEFRELSKSAIGLSQIRLKPVEETIQLVRDGGILALDGGHSAMTLGGEDEKSALLSYRQTLDRISFTPIISQNIYKINAVTQGQDILAYHVRHGDVTTTYRTKNKPWPTKFIPSEFYVQHFKTNSINNGSKALLFGDFEPSLNWLCKQCPELIRIGDVVDFGPLGSLQRDFLELYAMSRAANIVGPRSSGFSQLAANLGGIEFTNIMTALRPDDYSKAFKRLYDRIDQTPEDFSSDGEIGQCLAHLIPYLLRKDQTAKAEQLLNKEIKRGNNISFLYPLLASSSLKQGNNEGVLKTRADSTLQPLSDPTSIAELDAVASQAAFKLGDRDEASRLLCMSVFHTPFAPQARIAFEMLDSAGALNDRNFYPLDRELMDILNPKGSVFDPVFFAWEWRYSLISNFQRPLTHAGAADLLIKKIDALFYSKGPHSDRLIASLNSFKSLVLMGQGHTEEALSLSITAVDDQPDDPIIVKRHVQNLIQSRIYDLGLRFAEHLVDICPEVPMYQALVGDCLLGKRKRKRAVQRFEVFNENKVRFPGTALKHSTALTQLDQANDAVTLLDKILPEVRWTDQFLTIQTTAKIAMGIQNDLLPFLQTLEKESQGKRHISYLIAKIKQANGEIQSAIPDAENALKYHPNIGRFKVLLATLYQQAGRDADAAQLIEQLPLPMQKRFKT